MDDARGAGPIQLPLRWGVAASTGRVSVSRGVGRCRRVGGTRVEKRTSTVALVGRNRGLSAGQGVAPCTRHQPARRRSRSRLHERRSSSWVPPERKSKRQIRSRNISFSRFASHSTNEPPVLARRTTTNGRQRQTDSTLDAPLTTRQSTAAACAARSCLSALSLTVSHRARTVLQPCLRRHCSPDAAPLT